MDSDGALQSMATLTLADLDDDDGIQQVGNVSLGPLGDVSEFYVVGCLVTDKPIKFMFFRDTMHGFGQKKLRGFELELGNFFLVENENMINEMAHVPLSVSGPCAAVSELTAAHVPLCERRDSSQPMGRCQRAAAPLTARHGLSV
nr:uncharacterized protein LOC109150754 [Ipomoea trifida]